MPGFNGTGPCGEGSMTGGGMGYCVIPLDTPGQELDYLKKRTRVLKVQLKQLRTQIRKLEKAKTETAI